MPTKQAVFNTKRLPNLTDPGTIKELMRIFRIVPRRSRGQNFIINSSALDKITRAASLSREDLVIEIGPGLGALTAELIQKAGKVTAIEIDPKLYAILQQTFARWPFDNLNFINEDALTFDIGSLAQRSIDQSSELKQYKIVANLPYSITGRMIRRILEAKPGPHSIVLLVQKEVAERMVANPPKMSILGVAVQTYGKAEIISTVKPGSFMPKPNVNSAIIRVKMHKRPLFGDLDSKKYFKVVKAGFSQKRKTLSNALSGGLAQDKKEIENKLKSINIDPSVRAQHLKIEEWVRIAEAL
ncbi:16S rRNA (adenine(1518)-N(6)/adenine(1519)-N(6))-dimethyltransferase RsmA [Patescibacteria group bacterium]